MAKQVTVPTSIVVKKTTTAPTGAPTQPTVYDFYNIVEQVGIDGKPVQTRVLRSSMTKQQLLDQKKYHANEIIRIDKDLADIAKVV